MLIGSSDPIASQSEPDFSYNAASELMGRIGGAGLNLEQCPSNIGRSRSDSLAYVADDEETIAKTLTLILNASGLDAMAFTEALKALSAGETRCPGLLIRDVSMPLLNGIELGIRFKALNPQCRALLFGPIRAADLSRRTIL